MLTFSLFNAGFCSYFLLLLQAVSWTFSPLISCERPPPLLGLPRAIHISVLWELCSLVDLKSQKCMLLSPVGVSKDRACGVGPLGCKGSSDVPSRVGAISKDSFSQRKVCTQIQSLAFSLLLRLCWGMLLSPLSPYMRPFALSPLRAHRFVHIGCNLGLYVLWSNSDGNEQDAEGNELFEGLKDKHDANTEHKIY